MFLLALGNLSRFSFTGAQNFHRLDQVCKLTYFSILLCNIVPLFSPLFGLCLWYGKLTYFYILTAPLFPYFFPPVLWLCRPLALVLVFAILHNTAIQQIFGWHISSLKLMTFNIVSYVFLWLGPMISAFNFCECFYFIFHVAMQALASCWSFPMLVGKVFHVEWRNLHQ